MSNGNGGGTLANKSPSKLYTLSNINWIDRSGGLLFFSADHDKGQNASPGVIGVVSILNDALKQAQGTAQGSCITPNKGARHFNFSGIWVLVGRKKIL